MAAVSPSPREPIPASFAGWLSHLVILDNYSSPSHLEFGLSIVLSTFPSFLRGPDFPGSDIPGVPEPSWLQRSGDSLEPSLIALLGPGRWPCPPGVNTSSLTWVGNTTALLVLELRHVCLPHTLTSIGGL